MDLNPLKIDRGQTVARARRKSGSWVARLLILALFGAALVYFRVPLLAAADRWRLPRVRAIQAVETSALSNSAVSGMASNGYIVPRVRAALSADAPGRIVELNVHEGTVVKQGEVVARLYFEEFAAMLRAAEAEVLAAGATTTRALAEAQTLRKAEGAQRARLAAAQARLTVAQTDLDLATREHARLAQLEPQGFASAQALDQAASAVQRFRSLLQSEQASLDLAAGELAQASAAVAAADAAVAEAAARITVAEANREQAAATLDKTYVRAPFDGVVVLKDAEIGEVVSPNSLGGNSRGSVATMVDFASLEAQVELPETNISGVNIGDPAAIFLDSYPTHRYEGRVDRIWPTANRQKASIEVRVLFLAPDERLRPEMGVRVVFSPSASDTASASAEQGQIRLPAGCVLRSATGSYVLIVDRGRLRQQVVELGPEASGSYTIKAGVRVGELVVRDPAEGLAAGDRVLLEE